MATMRPSAFDAVLERRYERSGVDTLPAHLVERADQRKPQPLVPRLFSAARPFAAAEADLAVLRYLAEVGFPAERPFGSAGVTSHEGQAVLMTEFIEEAPKADRPLTRSSASAP
jgi:hypothetical protein